MVEIPLEAKQSFVIIKESWLYSHKIFWKPMQGKIIQEFADLWEPKDPKIFYKASKGLYLTLKS